MLSHGGKDCGERRVKRCRISRLSDRDRNDYVTMSARYCLLMLNARTLTPFARLLASGGHGDA
jgi:hypothetical protein